MSSDGAVITIQAVSKVYHVYERPFDRLKQMVLPRIGVVPGASRWKERRYGTEFWALRDIGLEVARGESIGILGRNGSGKSTLLQIIAGTLMPTTGSVEVKGRVAALLELGSGFNPEFTGRENVMINGMILGLSEREVNERFDAIAGFADIGDFIDQPLKTYSSGMMLRLAFAVQTQIEPDILIVDEALSVGDALFQKRCIQKMESLRSDGCTLIFVSHDQESVRTLTNRAILLRDGTVRSSGPSADVVLDYRRQLHEDEKQYFAKLAEEAARTEPVRQASDEVQPVVVGSPMVADDPLSFGDREAEVLEVSVLDADGNACSYFYPKDAVRIRVRCIARKVFKNLNVGLRIRNKEGVKMYSWGTLNQDISGWHGQQGFESFWSRHFSPNEEFTVEFDFDVSIGLGFYEVQAAVSHELTPDYANQQMLHWRDEAAFFQVSMKPDEYRFGGVADMAMRARLVDDC